MKKWICTLIALASIGCAHGPIAGKYPPPYESENPATVVVSRPSAFFACGVVPKISFDGEIIYRIGNGDRLEFNVDQGRHTIGILDRNPWSLGLQHHELNIDCLNEHVYHFLIKMHMNIAATIEQVGITQ